MGFVEEVCERMPNGRADIFNANMLGDRLVHLGLRFMFLIA